MKRIIYMLLVLAIMTTGCGTGNKTRVENKFEKKDENIEFWIQPDGYKYSWDNCARVIIEKKDKELAPYMSLLLKWLQDLNWPGALLVLERLKHVEPKFIIRDLEKTINEATQNNDLAWIEFLSELTESKTILEGLDENVKKTLLDLK